MTYLERVSLVVRVAQDFGGKRYKQRNEAIYRVISPYITALLVGTRVKPNHVSVVNLGVAMCAVWSFYLGGSGFIIGVVALFINQVLDCVDGELARLKQLTSVTGLYLDRLSSLMYPGIVLAMGAGAAIRTGSSVLAVLGVAACAGNILYRYAFFAACTSILEVLASGGSERTRHQLRGAFSNELVDARGRALRFAHQIGLWMASGYGFEWALWLSLLVHFALDSYMPVVAFLAFEAGITGAGFLAQVVSYVHGNRLDRILARLNG
ncbi:MAG: CDP-alcohol phosphatidyltransferase family protein [Bacillota bacterium]